MKFAKIYLLGSIGLFLLSMIFQKQLDSFVGGTAGIVWILWSFVALTKFQKANIPLTVPMLCPLGVGISFQLCSLSFVASGNLSKVFAVLAPVAIYTCLAGFVLLSVRLFIQLNQKVIVPDKLVSQSYHHGSYAGFWHRLLAMAIDGVIVGLVGIILFGVIAIVAAGIGITSLHKSQSDVLTWSFSSKVFSNLWWPSGAFGTMTLIGFMFGFLAPVAGFSNLLCSFAYLSRVTTVPSNEQINILVAVTTMALINVFSLAYYSLMEGSHYQGTIGKTILGLYVVDKNGQRLSCQQALLRNVMKFLSLGTFGLGYAYIGISPTKQSLHDLLANSLITRRSSSTAK